MEHDATPEFYNASDAPGILCVLKMDGCKFPGCICKCHVCPICHTPSHEGDCR